MEKSQISFVYNISLLYDTPPLLCIQVVLENSGRAIDQDCPFVQASLQLTSDLCELLNIGQSRKYFFVF